MLGQRPDSPDMVYAMNLGLVVNAGPAGTDRRVVLSHMRYAERRIETLTAQPWFGEHGFAGTYVGRDGVGAHFEAGDAFAWRGRARRGLRPAHRGARPQAPGHRARTSGSAACGSRTRGCTTSTSAFCPLDETRAMVCPAALDDASAAALLALVPEPLVLTEEEALTFCANSVVVGSTVLMPAVPDRVRAQLEDWGFEVVLVDVGEFHKGGGSVRCLTNPLDVVRGRDLPRVAGGEVLLP